MLELEIDLIGIDSVFKQLERVLTPLELRKFMQKLGTRAIALNRRRIKRQENLDGSKFDPRSDGGKDKMLENVFRQKKRKQYKKTVDPDSKGVTLTILNPITKRIHFGESNWFNLKSPSEIKRAAGGRLERLKKRSEPCAQEQAKLLQSQIGMKASVEKLQKHFNRAVAEKVLLKHHRKYNGAKELPQPARDVLGLGKKEEILLVQLAEKELEKIIPNQV